MQYPLESCRVHGCPGRRHGSALNTPQADKKNTDINISVIIKNRLILIVLLYSKDLNKDGNSFIISLDIIDTSDNLLAHLSPANECK